MTPFVIVEEILEGEAVPTTINVNTVRMIVPNNDSKLCTIYFVGGEELEVEGNLEHVTDTLNYAFGED